MTTGEMLSTNQDAPACPRLALGRAECDDARHYCPRHERHFCAACTTMPRRLRGRAAREEEG